ncbi:PIG-L deacetylase family protein [Flindersiella endophytica]
MVLSDSEVSRALVITAHPDDVDFAAAGTIAGWTAAGIEVVYCICTDGQAGGFDVDLDRAELPRIRRAEQEAAARAVGVTDLRFLGRMDGELVADAGLVRELTAVIRSVRPDRLLTQSPERIWEHLVRSHPDHLAAGEAAIRAMYPAAQNAFAFPDLLAGQGLEPWNVREFWLADHPGEPNHVVDVTETFETKLTAVFSHESQHKEPEQLRAALKQGFTQSAVSAGLGEGRQAETFNVYPTP